MGTGNYDWGKIPVALGNVKHRFSAEKNLRYDSTSENMELLPSHLLSGA